MTLKSSDAAIAFIIGEEVTDQQVYDQSDLHPTWPDGDSGVTIGIGYDLGYATRDQVANDWRYLDPATVARLQSVVGITGTPAATHALALRDITVPFDTAETVFTNVDMPRTEALVMAKFPNAGLLSGDSFGALTSLVFNRGADCSDTDSRREMHQILGAMTAKDFQAIPDMIRAMRRLWPTLPGLQTRRAAEAAMFADGLPVPAKTVPSGTILVVGSIGPLVVALQTALKAAGYYKGYAIDGNFGPATRAAVADLQGAHGLFVDGVAGAKTWAALGFTEGTTS